jgi:hypothetical protein
MLMASWPDIVRDKNFDTRYKKYHKSNWHYSDTFWEWKDGKAVFVETSEPGGMALEKIKDFRELISSPATDAEKAVAIVWLEHLIGDIHQPLHTSAKVTDSNPKGDQGGNLFLLTPKGTPRDKQLNLHSFWDSIIGRNFANINDGCDADYIDPIANSIIKKYPYDKMKENIQANDIDSWAKESLNFATSEVYSGVRFFESPSEKYKKKALEIAEKRMALAGYRMAQVFNGAFGSPPASKMGS